MFRQPAFKRCYCQTVRNVPTFFLRIPFRAKLLCLILFLVGHGEILHMVEIRSEKLSCKYIDIRDQGSAVSLSSAISRDFQSRVQPFSETHPMIVSTHINTVFPWSGKPFSSRHPVPAMHRSAPSRMLHGPFAGPRSSLAGAVIRHPQIEDSSIALLRFPTIGQGRT